MTAVTEVAPTEVSVITEAGVYDLTSDAYHADPVPARVGGSLSSSGAKLLLPPSCPAIYQWARTHPTFKDTFDFGHAAHTLVLGVGAEIVTVDADAWTTKAAKKAKTQAHAEGKTPLLAKDVAVVKAMAEQLRRHPIAAALFDPERGKPEQALFTQDQASGGVWLRAMLDWLPDVGPGRLIIGDYKTTAGNGDPAAFDKTMGDYRYYGQAAWYVDLAIALGLDPDPGFLFVVQSKVAPYLVSVIEPDSAAIRAGREENRAAIDLFAQCTSNDQWPGYGDDITLASLPPWHQPRLPKDTP